MMEDMLIHNRNCENVEPTYYEYKCSDVRKKINGEMLF